MHVLLDHHRSKTPAQLTDDSTLGDVLQWARARLAAGRIIVAVKRDGVVLEGTALTDACRDPVGGAALELVSAERKELCLTMLGKLAALVDWLGPQHKEVAAFFERGDTKTGISRFDEIRKAWVQIVSAYANLAKMLEISLKELRVGELSAEDLLNEFCRHLEELQTALQNQDFVLLADILQYEMDGALDNWRAILEATLGLIEPVPAT